MGRHRDHDLESGGHWNEGPRVSLRRPVVAGPLWPVATEGIAFSSLHTALAH
jgi:hypothetical protein